MLEYQPRYDLNIATEGVEPDCLTPKLLNRLKLRAGDEGKGSARHVAGHDLYRGSLDRCSHQRANHRIIIDFSAD